MGSGALTAPLERGTPRWKMQGVLGGGVFGPSFPSHRDKCCWVTDASAVMSEWGRCLSFCSSGEVTEGNR